MGEVEKIKCRSCQALNDASRTTCEKCGEILIPEAAIVVNDGNVVFMAESSDGLLEHQAGFFRRLSEKWIVAELTLLRGVELVKKKKGNVQTRSSIRAILVYNKNGDRGYASLKNRTIDFEGKTIVLEGTLINKPLETLMSYDTVISFLNGRTEDLASIHLALKLRVEKFVNFEWDPRLYDLVACIIIATFFFDVFGAFPIIFVYGPPETGKGRVVKCIIYGGRKGLLYVSPTPAPIFRGIDAIRPTLGVDEFTKMYEELMQLARAIYKKGLMVPRMVKRGGGLWLTFFETYTPLILASTRELDSVTMSRTIVINMKRAKDPSKRDPEPWDFEDIRDRLYICRLTQAHVVDRAKTELDGMKLQLLGRDYEIWRPVLTIAKIIGDDLFEKMLELAEELTARKYEGMYEQEKDILSAIHQLFSPQLTLEGETPSELTFYPKQVSDTLWELKQAEFGYEETGSEKIDASMYVAARKKFDDVYGSRKIGWVLKRLGLKHQHTTRGNEYRLTYKDFLDMAKRFGMTFE